MKTTRLFLFGLMCAAFPSLAQDTTASRFKFGLSASADYCSEMIYYDGVYQQNSIYYNFENPSIGWSGGFTSSFDLNSHFQLTGGIRYREHRLASGDITLTDYTGTIIGSLNHWYVSRFIDIPLGVQYTSHPDARVTFIANAALAPGYAMGTWFKIKAEAPDSIGIENGQTRQDINNFNPFSLTAELYTGIGIKIGRGQLQLLPQARYHLLMVTTENPVNRRNWSTGIEARIVYPL